MHQVTFPLQQLYRDARSTIHEIHIRVAYYLPNLQMLVQCCY